MDTVLITGGTGLLGSRLTTFLHEKGYKVRYLSRSPEKVKDVEAFHWDVKQQTIDVQAFNGVDHIIHLAGAGVADERWTKHRKKVILDSRTRSTTLIRDTLRKHPGQVKSVIAASAIGYYGYDTGGVLRTEKSRFGDDFLATVTKAWEAETDLISDQGIRTVKIRIGIVLSTEGGALAAMAKPVKLGLGAPLGNGEQFMSWIHIDDLCRMFIYAMEHEEMSGAYNAVAPNPVTNKTLTKKLAGVLDKPAFMPPVPGFVLKMALGEMASMVLGGSKVSSEKIEVAGFQFSYPEIDKALNDLFSK